MQKSEKMMFVLINTVLLQIVYNILHFIKNVGPLDAINDKFL